MARGNVCFCITILVLKCLPSEAILLVIPEDVSTGLAGIYGFTPRIVKGNDHRVGFGFRFGNHADFQVLYEFGPQLYTMPMTPIRVRSAAYRSRVVRRRPLIELLVRAGLLDVRSEGFEFDVVKQGFDEPR